MSSLTTRSSNHYHGTNFTIANDVQLYEENTGSVSYVWVANPKHGKVRLHIDVLFELCCLLLSLFVTAFNYEYQLIWL